MSTKVNRMRKSETFYACFRHLCALSHEEAQFLITHQADCPMCGCVLGAHKGV